MEMGPVVKRLPHWDGPETGNLDQRRAAAQAVEIARNRARQSEATPAQPEVTRVPLDPQCTRLVHDLGLSNQAESYEFAERFFAMMTDLNVQGALIIQLQHETLVLKEDLADLKRRKGLPLKAETR